MLNFQIIGNLGADAEVKQFNSGNYVSFRVAHNYKDGDKDKSVWISCLLRGDGGRLLDYLKKGQAVFVSGRGSARAFSSHITKQFEVGLDCNVDRVELLGSPTKITPENIAKAIESGALNQNDLQELIAF